MSALVVFCDVVAEATFAVWQVTMVMTAEKKAVLAHGQSVPS